MSPATELRLADFDFTLPEEQIAQRPVRRGRSRLLTLEPDPAL